MSEKLGLRFEFRVGLEMAVTAANAADRDVFAAKHSVPKGLVGAQSGRSRHGKRMFRKRLFPEGGISGIM